MGMPNQVHEAARQILEHSSDIHGALALCGRHDLTKKIIKIQKKAACIIHLEGNSGSCTPNLTAGYRNDLLNSVGALGHVIGRATNELLEDVSDEDLVTIIRTAEIVVRRGHVYLDKVVEREGYFSQTIKGDDDDECA